MHVQLTRNGRATAVLATCVCVCLSVAVRVRAWVWGGGVDGSASGPTCRQQSMSRALDDKWVDNEDDRILGFCTVQSHEVSGRFRSEYCLHYQGDWSRLHAAVTQKAASFMPAAVKTWNLTKQKTISWKFFRRWNEINRATTSFPL
jgi:hypothetical protein